MHYSKKIVFKYFQYFSIFFIFQPQMGILHLAAGRIHRVELFPFLKEKTLFQMGPIELEKGPFRNVSTLPNLWDMMFLPFKMVVSVELHQRQSPPSKNMENQQHVNQTAKGVLGPIMFTRSIRVYFFIRYSLSYFLCYNFIH